MKRRINHSAVSVCILMLAAYPALPQRNTASILGSVTDPSGGRVVNAGVRAVNTQTGVEYPTASDSLGNFLIPELPPGRYTLMVSAPGFKQFVDENIVLNVDQRPQIHVVLQVGSATESVTVTGAAPLVDSTHAHIGGVVEQVQVQQLPLNGRQFLQLALLLPGTSPAAGGQTVARGGGPRNVGFQGGGNRATNNSYLIDGVDSFGFRFKNTSLRPSVSSIQEFKILESPYDPQYGVASGVHVSVVTKSGGNQVHGELFEFLRNDRLDARNFFDLRKPPYRQNQFGGAVGGPIRRNQTFFFGSYEGFRSRRGQTLSAQVPTPEELSGNFQSDPRTLLDPTTRQPFPGKVIPASRFSEVSKRFIPFYPAPNTALRAPNYINAASASLVDDQYVVKADHTFSEKFRAFARYSYSNVDSFTPGSIPIFGTENDMAVQNAVLGGTWVVSPRTFVDVRIGYNREDALNQSEQIGKLKSASFGIPGLLVPPEVDGVPQVSVQGFATLGDAINSPEGRVENSEQFTGNLTRVHGRHTIKVGGNVWPLQLNKVFLSGIQRGQFSFQNIFAGGTTGLPEFLLGLPQTATRNIGLVRNDARSVLVNAYFADDIRVNRRVTLALGVRYELRPSFIDKENRRAVFIPEGRGKFVVAGDPNNGFSGRMNRSLYRTPAKNFAPRASLAMDLTGDGRTVLRTGYGIFFNMEIYNSQLLDALNPPFSIFQTFQADPALGIVLPFNNPFASTDPRAGGLPAGYGITPWFRQGYMQQWSFGIQRQLAASLVLDVSYVGNKGTALDGVRLINQGALPGAPNAAYVRQFPDFGAHITADSHGDSNYHSFQTKVTQRLAHGLSFIGSYTWGHAIDNSNGEGNGSGGQFFVMDDRNVRLDRGESDFDTRHRATFGGVYSLPFGARAVWGGWQIAAIYQVQTGFPTAIAQSGNRSGTFAIGERADTTCNGNLPGGQRRRERWFNTGCFALSPLGRFGNSARGAITRPGQNNLDFSVIKQTALGEKAVLEFRGEFFNLANHTQWLMTGGLGTNVSAPATFGVITAAQDPRIIQFGLKLGF